MTPLIGLTTYREDARWGVWDQRADLLPAQYAEAVISCGGVPVLLPPVSTPGAADVAVARLDGLVISGLRPTFVAPEIDSEESGGVGMAIVIRPVTQAGK